MRFVYKRGRFAMKGPMVFRTDCPMCGSSEHSLVCKIIPEDLFYGYVYTVTHLGPQPPDEYRIWRCINCNHWFVNPRLSEEDLLACYQPDHYTQGVGYQQFDTLWRGKTQIANPRNSDESWIEHWKRRVARLLSLNLPQDSVLDVGCADGAFLHKIPSSWERTGIDNNPGAIQFAQEISDGTIEFICTDLTAHDWQNRRFGAVTIFDTLEHVVNPQIVIAKVSELLLPGGICWIDTPSCNSQGARFFGRNWALLTPAVHLHYFDVRSLTRVLEHYGLIVESLRVGHATPLSALLTDLRYRKRRWFLKLLLGYGSVSRVLYTALVTLGVIESHPLFLRKLANINAAESLRPRLDDSVEVIARKVKI